MATVFEALAEELPGAELAAGAGVAGAGAGAEGAAGAVVCCTGAAAVEAAAGAGAAAAGAAAGVAAVAGGVDSLDALEAELSDAGAGVAVDVPGGAEGAAPAWVIGLVSCTAGAG